MASSPLKRIVVKSRPYQATSTSAGLFGLAVLLVWASGCAGVDKPEPGPRIPNVDQPFLVAPSTGYPLTMGPAEGDRVDEAFENLIQYGERDEAISVSRQILGRDPDFHPATLLAAQVAFLDGDVGQARELLTPRAVELSQYTGWQLLLGRSAEAQDDFVAAFEAYANVASRNRAAKGKTDALRPRVVQILTLRIEDDLQKGRTEDATEELARMERLLPDETLTLESAAEVARATDNPEAELQAVTRLSARSPDDRSLAERRANLELVVGDAGAGLRVFQELVAENPADEQLQDQLARAEFLWRLQLLPIEARDLVNRRELSRGDFAAMLYWLFPEVKYGQGLQVRIANDVLDQPYREEIVRVVNLGIMDVDERLHQFSPTRAVSRSEALTAMVRLLSRKEPPLACVGGVRGTDMLGVETVCGVGINCGLLTSGADCRPTASVSGSEAIELSRLTLNLLGIPQ